MVIHNKLVRDKIPQIIENSGKNPIIKTLDQDTFLTELRKKANEELNEYLSAKTNEDAIEELADLLEIIHSLAEIHDSSIEEIEKVRAEKADKRGGFKEKVFLIEVQDD